MLFAAACGDSRSDAARELCRQSESEIAAGRHYAAIGLLDTLDSRYRDLTEVRRSGMAIRARAMEGIALDSIPLYDARLAAATLAVDSMRPLFEHVDGAPGIDGYYLPKGTDRRAFATTGIQGRVSDDGLFYIAASVAGRSIGLRALELRSGAETCTSADISPARVVTVRGSEAASFSPGRGGCARPVADSTPRTGEACAPRTPLRHKPGTQCPPAERDSRLLCLCQGSAGTAHSLDTPRKVRAHARHCPRPDCKPHTGTRQ